MVGAPFLETFKVRMDKALGNLIYDMESVSLLVTAAITSSAVALSAAVSDLSMLWVTPYSAQQQQELPTVPRLQGWFGSHKKPQLTH